MEQDAVRVDQADAVTPAHESDRCSLDDGHPQLIGQQSHDGSVFHPRQLLERRATLRQRDEEDVAAQVRTKYREQFGPGHLAVAHDLDRRGAGDAKARIVTEEVTYTERQQEKRAEGAEERRRCGNTAGNARRNETAANWDAPSCAQKSIFFQLGIAAGIPGRPASPFALGRNFLRHFGTRVRWRRGAIEISHRLVRFIVREHRVTACL